MKYIKPGITVIVISVAMIVIVLYTDRTTVSEMNRDLHIAEMKLGMREEQVIQLWGTGDYRKGLGGHGREYKDKKVFLGFADDRDHDLYGSVSSIEIFNPNYTVFDIRIGDSFIEARDKMIKSGFKIENQIYKKDEFTVTIHGENVIESIQISFHDKDLLDRQY
jgi:hypothetical protein